MEHNKFLFDMVRDKKWDKLVKHVTDNINIDLNIQDQYGNFLISYVIAHNEPAVVKVLLSNGAHIDYIDKEGRTALFTPIKYNYSKMVDVILQHDAKMVGLSIIDMKDHRGNVPLHYAIMYKNKNMARKILDAGSDPNVIDNDGNTSLHMAVQSSDVPTCRLLLNNTANVNARNLAGESPLHIACNVQNIDIIHMLVEQKADVNTRDFDNNITSLMYAVNLNNVNITKYLLDHGADPNIQDFIGNTVIHYAIIEENYQILHAILEKTNINFNLFNIDGKIPMHLVVEKQTQIDTKDYHRIIHESNLNMPDNSGNTPLHFLVMTGKWKTITTELKKKKLNLVLANKKGRRPIDYVPTNDQDDIINLCVNSYLYCLRHYNALWEHEWEIICGKEQMDPKEQEILDKYVKGKRKNNTDTCRQIIHDKMIRMLKTTASTCSETTYPRKKNKQCVKMNYSTDVEFCGFTGITMDILLGLVYLLRKFPGACSTMPHNFTHNQNLCEYYRIIGVSTTLRCDFFNFEIVWLERKIFFTDKFDEYFSKCVNQSTSRFIIIPMGIEMREGNHANYLIYDIKHKELERFEPYGSHPPYNFNYNALLLDDILASRFQSIDNDIKYVSPLDYLPKIGFQYLDVIEKKTQKLGDPGGFCAVWSIWYCEMRMIYSGIDRKTLVNKLMKEIKTNSVSYRDLIRNYASTIVHLRDKVLQAAGININNLLNDQITHEQLQTIVDEITKLLKT